MMKYVLPLLLLTLACPNIGNCQSDKKEGTDNKDKKTEQKFDVADGELNFVAPGNWKKIQPKFDFYHAEFNIPKSEGDDKEGRITFSQVGGGIDANLDRWIGQFADTPEDGIKRETKTIDGKKVRLLQLSGTFNDGGGRPFGPKTKRENYKLIGAAIEMKKGSAVYIKAYGPAKTMDANKKHIEKMIANMKVADG